MMPRMMPQMTPDKMPGNPNEICVPSGALSASDSGGVETPPAVGDTVEFTVTGKVSRAEGGEVYVVPATINGEPMAEGEEGPSEQDRDAKEEADIMAALQNSKEGDPV